MRSSVCARGSSMSPAWAVWCTALITIHRVVAALASLHAIHLSVVSCLMVSLRTYFGTISITETCVHAGLSHIVQKNTKVQMRR